jgi:hypothetical protein
MAKPISPAAPHGNKAARALHRTAPNTTADCAVPPLFHQSTKPEMVACPMQQYWKAEAARAASMAMRECGR